MGPAMAAAAGLNLVGMFMGAYGQHKAGKVNQHLSEYNAGVAEWQADDAIRRGGVDATRRRTMTRGTIGSQRVSLARQGVEINDGSALDVQADSAYLGELDAQTIQNNAAREAWGFKVQAYDMRLRGDAQRTQGDMAAVNTLLTGSSNLLLASRGFGRSQFSENPQLLRSAG